jgi:hypothetical protein
MRAIAGTLVSAGAAVVYVILSLMFMLIDPLVLLEAATTLMEGFVLFILSIAFLPFIMFLKIFAIVVFALVITGAILIRKKVQGGRHHHDRGLGGGRSFRLVLVLHPIGRWPRGWHTSIEREMSFLLLFFFHSIPGVVSTSSARRDE